MRSRLWHVALAYLLIGLLGLLRGCPSEPDDLELNRQAPIVIDAPVLSCHLSPSRRYVDTVIDTGTSFQEYRIYDLTNGQQVVADLLPPDRDYASWIWLDGDIRFHMTRYQEPTLDIPHPIPLNGWLVDIPNHLITDVLSLDTGDQAHIFEQVDQAFRQLNREMSASISPNGRFISSANIIWEYRSPGVERGTMLNSSDHGNTQGCTFGWKPDSSGVYFVDHGGGAWANATGGPIRFLPVEPIK
jgi:hypothetical protein